MCDQTVTKATLTVAFVFFYCFSALAQENSFLVKSVDVHAQEVTSLSFSSDGNHLASGSKNGEVVMLSFPDLEIKESYSDAHTSSVNAVSFSNDNLKLLSGSDDETADIWDVASGSHILKLGHLPSKDGGIQIGSSDISIYDSRFTLDGKKVLTCGGNVIASRNLVRVYDASNGEMLKAHVIHANLVLSLDIHPDGRSFVSSSASTGGNGSVILSDIETGNAIRVYGDHFGDVKAVEFSRDAKFVAAATERMIIIWDTKTGAKIATLEGHFGHVDDISFSSDGKYIASTSAYDKKIIIWQTETWEELYTLENETGSQRIAFSPDGKYLVAGNEDGQIKVWDATAIEKVAPQKKVKSETEIMLRVRRENTSPFSNLKQIPELVLENGTHNDLVQSLKFTKDGREIVTASWDKTIRIWEASNGRLIRTIHVPQYAGIEGQIYTMDISPDQKFIAVAGSSVGMKYDKKSENYIGDYVLLIDYKTGKIVDVTTDNKQSIFGVAFSPDGKKLALCAGQLDNSVKIYSLDPVKGKLTLSDSFVMTIIAKEYFPACESIFGDLCEHTVLSVKFSPDSKDLYVIDMHGMLIRYTPKGVTTEGSYKLIAESPGRKSAAVTGKLSAKAALRSLAVDPKGKYVACGDVNGKILIVDAKGKEGAKNESSEKLLATISLQKAATVMSIDFDPTGTQLLVCIGGEVRIYEVKLDGATTPVTITLPLLTFKDHEKSVTSAAFSQDGNSVISSGGDTNICYLWDAKTGKTKFKLGGDKFSNKVTRVGMHKSNPFLIGFGNDLFEQQHVNHFGKITKAFDMKTLRVVDHADEADFMTAETDSTAMRPDFKTWFDEQMLSYLGLKNGAIVISSESALFLNNAATLLTITGARSYGMANSNDGETFYVGQSDGQIRIYDTKTLKLVATLYVAFNNEWILFTPDGYYTSSKYGSKLVGWLINDGVRNAPKFYPFEQFDVRLNRPDIVLSRIGGYPKRRIELLYKAYQKRLEKMGIDEKTLSDNLEAPKLEVDLSVSESTQKLLSFKVNAADAQSNLDRLIVYVNDVPLYGSKGFPLKASASKTLDKQVIVELTNGQNKIQVSVLNTSGVESFQETRYVNYRGAIVIPNLYVLAIGVSSYTDKTFNLQYAAKDATDIAALYAKQDGKFAAVKTMTILNEEATSEKIRMGKMFLKQARVDDEVILFVAGHGLLDNNLDFYFATTDVDFNNPSVRGLKYDELESLLDEVAARKKLMLIDACHSGEIDKDAVVVSDKPVATGQNSAVKSRGFKNLTNNDLGTTDIYELMRMMFADLRKGSGAMVISSASGVEFAFENDVWKNGVFTYSLLEGLKTGNANLNKDADVQVSELRDYVIKRVGELTNGKQTPTSRKENLEFDFKVW
jgi:WD40 repeat protein